MCGIAGAIIRDSLEAYRGIEKCFINSLSHRGPDASGAKWYETPLSKVLLVNTRLSVMDPENSHQPMELSEIGDAVVFNGELYNFEELREEIKTDTRWHTSGDTEVILKGLSSEGTSFLAKMNGEFAIAFLSQANNKLFLIRDRIGIKPLFYWTDPASGNTFFSSEIKAFLSIPQFNRQIDKSAIHDFLFFNYVPPPKTIFQNVLHVPPGAFLSVDLHSGHVSIHEYWTPPFDDTHFNVPTDNVVDQLDHLLQDAIKLRLRSDVGAAAFLSGGVDSSLVCAIAAKQLHTRLNTYSIGFQDSRFDETPFSKLVAEQYGLSHTVETISVDAFQSWPKVTWHNDQPHGDISFLPLFFLSQLAANHGKVILSGDGGDELFGGYTKYRLLEHNSPSSLTYQKALGLFHPTFLESLYSEDFKKQIEMDAPERFLVKALDRYRELDNINQGLVFDIEYLLPGNNLVKPDRMGMAHSLEIRTPFLDHRILEFSLQCAGKLKIRDGETKFLLKKLGERYLPKNLVYRPKQMLTVPVGEWFHGPLASVLEETLLQPPFVDRGIFNFSTLKKMVSDHLSRKVNYTRELRALFNLEIWFRLFSDGMEI